MVGLRWGAARRRRSVVGAVRVGMFGLALATGSAIAPAVAAGTATPPAVSRGALTLLDQSATGAVADAAPEGHVIVSPDAHWVAFVSTATNLLPGSPLPAGVARWFAVDVVTHQVLLLASPAHGSTPQDSSGTSVLRFSPDSASVLLTVSASGAESDVYLEKVATGARTLVSSAADGTRVNGDNVVNSESAQGHTMTDQTFSANGRYVSFLTIPVDGGPVAAFRKDLQTGALDRASITATGVTQRVVPSGVALSPDGRKEVFDGYGIPHAGRLLQTGLKNFATGVVKPVSRTQANVPAGGVLGNSKVFSPDGTTVYFTALRVPGVASTVSQVYSKNLTTGELRLLSAAPDGTPANALAGAATSGGTTGSSSSLPTARRWSSTRRRPTSSRSPRGARLATSCSSRTSSPEHSPSSRARPTARP